MSKGKPGDLCLTRRAKEETTQGDVQRASWLRHGAQRGSTIDHMLLFGATIQELLEQSGAGTEDSVHGHIQHLRDEHHLEVEHDNNGRYYFTLNPTR